MEAQTRKFCREISNDLDAFAHDELLIPEIEYIEKVLKKKFLVSSYLMQIPWEKD